MSVLSQEEHQHYLDRFLGTVAELHEKNDFGGICSLLPFIRTSLDVAHEAGYRDLALQYERLLEPYIPLIVRD